MGPVEEPEPEGDPAELEEEPAGHVDEQGPEDKQIGPVDDPEDEPMELENKTTGPVDVQELEDEPAGPSGQAGAKG